MRKLLFFLAFSVAVLMVLLSTVTKDENSREYSIAVINYSPAADEALDGLLEGLESYGYIKGKNLNVYYSGYIRDKAMLKKEAGYIVDMQPDLIYAMSTPAALAAKQAAKGTDIPVIFGPVSSPLETGIVQDLRSPGENITGVTFGPQEPRRMEMLLKIAPETKNILVPFNPNDKSPQVGIANMTPIAEKLGVNIILFEITAEMMLSEKLYGYKGDFDSIFLPTDSMMVSHTEKIAQFAILKKVPFSCPQQEGVEKGALFSYGFSVKNLGRQAARLVHMALTGTDAGEIPVELTEFNLSINVDTAEKIGIEIPDYLLKNSFIVRDR